MQYILHSAYCNMTHHKIKIIKHFIYMSNTFIYCYVHTKLSLLQLHLFGIRQKANICKLN